MSDSPASAPSEPPAVARAGSAPPWTDLPYHRLAARWRRPGRWRPLLGIALSGVLYATFLGVGIVTVAVATVVAGVDPGVSDTLDLYRPADFAFAMLAIILLLPATLLGFRLAGCAPIGLLSSVAGRLRWRWMLRLTVPALVVLVVALVAMAAFDPAWRGEGAPPPTRADRPALVAHVVLLVPLQAAAEEYVFRGTLAQTIGAWLRHPAWAILLPVPLFVLGHDYDLPGQLSVGVFAVATGWITWRTGGLEAAIALHVVNNVAAMLLGALGRTDLNATDQGWVSGIVSAAIPVAFAWWADRIWRRSASTQSRRMRR
ncbi:CPBP family intramembrane glutamic endopeptidase [Microbacterium sp. 18062]|uniref:CPBP family intramembrane glutamic endopeptidase n=1 Tax=Microbacterium sp. 18062 TaxID=2681410 RepID=UPI00135794F5|nr:type II CAAX endopeptidase family protein [Microbacterium sp. 18062]